MSKPIELSREARQAAAAGLRKVLIEELEVEVGTVQAEMVLDRLVLDLGPVLYNRALTDARAVIAAKAEERMTALTAEVARIDDDLANAAISNPKALEGLTRARAKTQADLDAAEAAWMQAEEALAEVS